MFIVGMLMCRHLVIFGMLMCRHLEKQHELLWEAYRSMTHELQKLQV